METFNKNLEEARQKLHQKEILLKRDMINRYRLYIRQKIKDYKPNPDLNKKCFLRTGEYSYDIIDYVSIENYGELIFAINPHSQQYVIFSKKQGMKKYESKVEAETAYFNIIQRRVKL